MRLKRGGTLKGGFFKKRLRERLPAVGEVGGQDLAVVKTVGTRSVVPESDWYGAMRDFPGGRGAMPLCGRCGLPLQRVKGGWGGGAGRSRPKGQLNRLGHRRGDPLGVGQVTVRKIC